MADSHGTFVWYELMTSDMHAAEQFYRHVVNWSVKPMDIGMDYRMLAAGEHPVGGMMALPDGAQISWMGYVCVTSVDETVAALLKAGGIVYREPWSMDEMGMRLAIVADPQGAAIALHQNLVEGRSMPDVPGNAPGIGSWRELHALDGDAAFKFYAPLFGWQELHVMDMGPETGSYRIFGKDGVQMGGMFSSPSAKAAGPFWFYYFNVEDADAAAARVTEAGGKVIGGPQDVPGGSRVIQCEDPQCARFALVQPGS